MNIFKGIFFSKDSTHLCEFIEPEFKNHLTNLIKKDEFIEIDKSFEKYSNNLLLQLQREKNFKIMNYFNNSPFKDLNNYCDSFNNYLNKLIQIYKSKNIKSEIINKLIDVKECYLSDEEKIIENKKNKSLLNDSLLLISSLNSGLNVYSSQIGYDLKSIIFIENFNEKNKLTHGNLNGTSFYFNSNDDLETMAIYLTKPKIDNNSLFDENLSKILLNEFKNSFDVFDAATKKYYSFKKNIIPNYNAKFSNNNKFDLKPIFLFQIEEFMPTYTKSFSNINEFEKENLMNISMSCQISQTQLFNNKINQELIISYLINKESKKKLLLIQKNNENFSNGCFYELINGNQNFSSICEKNNELLKNNNPLIIEEKLQNLLNNNL